MARSWSKPRFRQKSRTDPQNSDMHPEFQPAQSKAMLAGNMSKWLLWEGALLLFGPQSKADKTSQSPSMACLVRNILTPTIWRLTMEMCVPLSHERRLVTDNKFSWRITWPWQPRQTQTRQPIQLARRCIPSTLDSNCPTCFQPSYRSSAIFAIGFSWLTTRMTRTSSLHWLAQGSKADLVNFE
jgi:hypothetical protein